MNKFLNINFDTPSMKAGDWIISLVSLAVGIWYNWPLWIVMGCLGCIASWWRPLTKLQTFVRGILVRKARS